MNNSQKILSVLAFVCLIAITTTWYIFSEFKSGEIEIRGKVPPEYDINIMSVYGTRDNACQVSDWNTGGYKNGITHIRSQAINKNGKYYGKTYRYLKKNTCEWSLLYTNIEILPNRKKSLHTYTTYKPLYTLKISPSINNYDQIISLQNGELKEKLYCVREDSIVTNSLMDRHKHVEPSMICSTKSIGSYNNTIYFDGNFSIIHHIEIDILVKKGIYCFTGRRKCPAYTIIAYIDDIRNKLDIETGFKKPMLHSMYTYMISKKNRRQLHNTLDLDQAAYNPAQTKKLLDQNSSLITDPGYTLFQSVIAWDFAYGNIGFSELKMLYDYGYNLSKYQQEAYVSPKIILLLKNMDIEPPYLNQYYDYASLPTEVKQVLKEHNITRMNYYRYRPRKKRLLAMLGTDDIQQIKWLIEHGYSPEKGELEWALVSALRYRNLKNPVTTIKGYLELGANLKNPHVAFPLMDTMRNRLDDIATLRTLIDAGVNINAEDEYGQTILFSMNYKLGGHYRNMCSVKSNMETIKQYIRLGMDINHPDHQGKRPIEEEETPCNIEAFKMLGGTYSTK